MSNDIDKNTREDELNQNAQEASGATKENVGAPAPTLDGASVQGTASYESPDAQVGTGSEPQDRATDQPTTVSAPQTTQQAPVIVQQQAPTSGLAIASLVLGIVAILGSFVPILNLLTTPFALVALVLGIIGKLTLKKAGKAGEGLALAGMILGIVALLLTVGMYGCMSAASKASKTEQSSQSQTTQNSNDDEQARAEAEAKKKEEQKKAEEEAEAAKKKAEEEAKAKAAEEEAKAAEEETAKKAEEAAAAQASDAVDPELKDMLDSYEAFMDEYIEFMNTYQNSDDTVAMLAEYSDFMARYSDYMQKVDAVDSSNLSPADSAYYIEVTSRVSQKLLTASM